METNYHHPYVPRDMNIPDFTPNILSQSTILCIFGISSLLIIALIWSLSGHFFKLSKVDRLLMCWWVFTGLTHIILEGYFAFSPQFYKEETSYFLAEVWKEYSKGDSRYVGRDSGVVTIEGITAVIGGPTSLLAMYAIAKRTCYSHVLQIAISLGQLYGTAVYFITSYLDGNNFAANVYYYYIYYVFMNSFWVWIPTLIIIRSWKKICATFQDKVHEKKKFRFVGFSDGGNYGAPDYPLSVEYH